MSAHHLALDNVRWQKARRAALVRDGYRCTKCSRVGELHVDHILRLEDGGLPYALDNLQVLCSFPCHSEKTRKENTPPDPEREAWIDLILMAVDDFC